jgi:hypothetical protein
VTYTSPNGAAIQNQEVKLWVTTTNAETLRIAASITASSRTFHTHSPEAKPGGELDKGMFNSSMRIQPLAPMKFRAAAFLVEHVDSHVEPRFVIRQYTVRLNELNYRIRRLNIYHFTCYTGWFYAHVRGGDKTFFYAPDTTTVIDHVSMHPNHDTVRLRFNFDLWSAGIANMVVVMEINNPVGLEQPQVGKIGYIDNVGNESILYLREEASGSQIVLKDS